MNNFLERIKNTVPPVTLNLIIITLIFWLAQKTFPYTLRFDLTDALGLHYIGSSAFRIWQPITYMFLHATNTLTHFLFNMFSLFMFGIHIEQIWGGKRFLLFYIVCGLSAAAIQQLVWFFELAPIVANYTQVNVDGLLLSVPEYASLLTTIGASGAIYGILLAFGMLFPNAAIFIFFVPIPIRAKYAVIIFGLIELVLGFSGRGNVAHFTYLRGMLGALILILIWRKKHRIDGPFN